MWLKATFLPYFTFYVAFCQTFFCEDPDLFFTLLRKFDFSREAFQRDASGFSMGQQKKLLLAASMARPAHLYLWDEPLNYIDLESREQIEDMLRDTQATLVFIEHDRHFVDSVATELVEL